MFVIPLVLIYYSRKKFMESNLREGKLNKSLLQKNYQLIIIIVISLITFGLIIYGFFNKNDIKCVADKI